jgi:hypothetical protein
MPENGNSYNQLAVINTYQGKELSAIFMYFRSLVVKQSFPTALDNIKILLKKAVSKYTIEKKSNLDLNFSVLLAFLFNINEQLVDFKDISAKAIKEFEKENSMENLIDLILICLSALFVSQEKSIEFVGFLIELFNLVLLKCKTKILGHYNCIEEHGMMIDSDSNKWEKFLPILKLIVKALNSKMIESFIEYVDFSMVWRNTAEVATLIDREYKEMYKGNIPNEIPLFKEDLNLVGFLPLDGDITISGVFSDVQDEHEMIRIRCHTLINDVIKLTKKKVNTC